MTDAGDEHGSGGAGEGGTGPRAPLRAVDGPLGPAEPPPAVRLRREWKGLTTADLLREDLVQRLPGQVLAALRHIERGDFAAAERTLPGDFAAVLPGPGHRRRGRRRLVLLVVVAAVLTAAATASWFR